MEAEEPLMVWGKLDDGILDNPKLAQVGWLGFGLYAAGLVYCNRNLTDGFIPRASARTLLDTEYLASDGRILTVAVTSGMSGEDVTCAMVAEWLVAAGLWDMTDGGYLVHDFLDHNPSREQVEAKRNHISSVRASAGKRGAEARWNGKPMANGMANDGQTDGPEPVPVPVIDIKPPRKRGKDQPDEDQTYLAEQLERTWGQELTPAALQKLNAAYGRKVVTGALRELHGFPPEVAVKHLYAYVNTICKNREAE